MKTKTCDNMIWFMTRINSYAAVAFLFCAVKIGVIACGVKNFILGKIHFLGF